MYIFIYVDFQLEWRARVIIEINLYIARKDDSW